MQLDADELIQEKWLTKPITLEKERLFGFLVIFSECTEDCLQQSAQSLAMLHAYQADKCCWAGNLIPLLPLQNRCFVFTSDPFAFLFAYASILQSFPVYLKHFQSTSSVFRIPTYKLIRDSWDTSKIAKYTRKCKRPLVLPTFSMILLVWHIVSKGKDRSCP